MSAAGGGQMIGLSAGGSVGGRMTTEIVGSSVAGSGRGVGGGGGGGGLVLGRGAHPRGGARSKLKPSAASKRAGGAGSSVGVAGGAGGLGGGLTVGGAGMSIGR